MVIGFVSAMYLARWLARRYKEDPEHISGFTVYAMIAGVLGARIFHIIHFIDQYRDNWMDVFKIWNGGLEFLGGFLAVLVVMFFYFRRHKLNALKYMDILAVALMMGLGFGRIGCFINGCCFGKTTELPWGIVFPVYNTYTDFSVGAKPQQYWQYSHSYNYQLYPDNDRRPGEGPIIPLPDDYYDGYVDKDGHRVDSLEEVPADQRERYSRYVKPPGLLTEKQLQDMRRGGPYCMHPIHPTQIYSSLNAFGIMAILLIWHKRRFKAFDQGKPIAFGVLSALVLLLYGPTRIILEYLRSDSPKEFTGLTISQNLSILAILGGIGLMIYAIRHAKKQARKLESAGNTPG